MGPHENEFWLIQMQQWMLQTDRVKKVDEKNGIVYLVFMFAHWVMVLKLSKKVHFFAILGWSDQET